MFEFENITFTDFTDHTAGAELCNENHQQESHAEREILLVLAGNIDFVLAGKCFNASPGRAFFIDSWVPHQLGYGKLSGDITHIWVHLHARRLFAMPYMLSAGSRLQSSGMWEFPAPVLELINSRWAKASAAPAEMKKTFYRSIVRLLTEEIALQSSAFAEEKHREDDVIAWVKNYISMNYGRNSSLAELEHLTGFNRRHLMRKFKNECSMTIGEYINCVRRGFAAAAGRRLTQKEIAFQLGFKSPAAYWLWKKRDSE
ncbi:MAG: helix-turn-helix transcriptional regulator [Lentisphaeria bacterium]|nr:helix-turn-helix transcriptional regulator [Lentisphaeria bacterium]